MKIQMSAIYLTPVDKQLLNHCSPALQWRAQLVCGYKNHRGSIVKIPVPLVYSRNDTCPYNALIRNNGRNLSKRKVHTHTHVSLRIIITLVKRCLVFFFLRRISATLGIRRQNVLICLFCCDILKWKHWRDVRLISGLTTLWLIEMSDLICHLWWPDSLPLRLYL